MLSSDALRIRWVRGIPRWFSCIYGGIHGKEESKRQAVVCFTMPSDDF